MKRTPLKRSTKPMKRTPLNPVSKKRRSEMPRVDRWSKAVWERDGYQCQNPDCECHHGSTNPLCSILDAHHIWEKGPNKAWKFVLENGITLCRISHDLVHAGLLDLSTIGIERDALRAEFMAGIGTIID